MTRKSTPKYEVYHMDAGIVVLSGVSKTEATKFAREMQRGWKKSFAIRSVKLEG